MKLKKVIAGILFLTLMTGSVRIEAKIGLLGRFADDVILENLILGRTYNLREMGNLPYRVTNAGSAPVEVVIEIEIPSEGEIKPGYKPIHDPGWIKIVPDKFRLKPGESGIAEVLLTVPDEEKYVNCHFQARISAHTVATGFMGVGVSHRIRFSVGKAPETVEAEKKKKAMLTLKFEFKPRSMYLAEIRLGKKYKSGNKGIKKLKVINWADNSLHLKFRSVEYRTDFSLPSGYKPAPDPSWLKVGNDEFELKGNDINELKYSLKIPDDAANYNRKFAFLIKAEIVGVEVPLELYTRIYITTEEYEKK